MPLLKVYTPRGLVHATSVHVVGDVILYQRTLSTAQRWETYRWEMRLHIPRLGRACGGRHKNENALTRSLCPCLQVWDVVS